MKKILIILSFLILLSACDKNEEKQISETSSQEIITSEVLSLENGLKFSTKDLYGKKVSDQIFENYDLTMINIWATFCGPCIKEMPDLANLEDKLKGSNVNIIGLINDVRLDKDDKRWLGYSNVLKENEILAKEIIDEFDVGYTNIPFYPEFESYFMHFTAVPTTIFVDSQGMLVGKEIVGARGIDDYFSEIENRLKSMGVVFEGG